MLFCYLQWYNGIQLLIVDNIFDKPELLKQLATVCRKYQTVCRKYQIVSRKYQTVYRKYQTVCHKYQTVCHKYQTVCCKYKTVCCKYKKTWGLNLFYCIVVFISFESANCLCTVWCHLNLWLYIFYINVIYQVLLRGPIKINVTKQVRYTS